MWDLVFRLRHCANSRALQEGRRLHSELIAAGRHSDKFIGNLLVQMFGKCGSIAEAQQAFDQTQQRNVFSWNILITAYAQNGHLQCARQLLEKAPHWDTYSWNVVLTSHSELGYIEDAQAIFDAMPERDAISWTAILTVHAHTGHLQEACDAFNEMPNRDIAAWNAVVAAFSQNGELQAACDAFNHMPKRDLVSWNTLLAAFAQNGQIQEAMDLFDTMQQRDAISWNSMLQAYIEIGDGAAAKSLFDEMPRRSSSSWNTLLQVCALNGDLDAAFVTLNKMPQTDCLTWNSMLQLCVDAFMFEESNNIFHSMPQRDVVAWTSMIAAHAQKGQLQAGRSMLETMPQWNAVAWTVMLLAYAEQKNIVEAEKLFEQMPHRDLQSWNAMVTAYAQNGHLESARNFFDRMQQQDFGSWNAMLQAYALNGLLDEAVSLFGSMPQRGIVSWNTMLAAYAQSGRSKMALELFAKMDLEGPAADKVSFASAVDACARLQLLAEGRLLHLELKSSGIQADAVLLTALVNFYGRCGGVKEACDAFEGMADRDVASWNSMLVALWRNKLGKAALVHFGRMDIEGVRPDWITYIVVLDVCAGIAALSEGKLIHECIATQASCTSSTEISVLHMNTALINMYGRCGNLELARSIFESMPQRDIAAWNSIISRETGRASFQLLQRMDIEGECPDEVACSIVLDSCGVLNSMDSGKIIHTDALDAGILHSDCMGIALVNMYGRCGELEAAEKVFNEMSRQDTASWNSMLAGGARNGQSVWVLNMYRTMLLLGVLPDEVSFVAVLSACSHAGKLQSAWECFVSIDADHGSVHTVHQFNCMVDVLGRVGQLQRAEELTRTMPFEPMSLAWTSMLAACQSVGCLEQAENAVKFVLELEPERSSLYVLLYNILVTANSVS